jgi:PAS domain S-box-containing protein
VNTETNTILLADRNNQHIKTLKQALKKGPKQHHITAVNTLAAARTEISQKTPALAIIARRLPDGTGEELLPEYRWAPPFPIILTIDQTEEPRALEFIRAGAADVIPNTPEALTNICEAVDQALADWEATPTTNLLRQPSTEDDEAYFTFAEQSPDPMYQADVNGDCVFVNQPWCQLTGMSAEEAKGQGWIKSLHPDDLEMILANWNNRIETDGHWGLEYRFITPEGKTKWVIAHARPMRDEHNQVVGFRGTNVDITERKLAEEALKKNEEKYRLLAANVSDVIWTMDFDLNYTYVSPSVEKARGYTPEELIELGPQHATTKESFDSTSNLLEKALEKDKNFGKGLDPDRSLTIEIVSVRKDGSTYDAEMVVSFLRDEQGTPTGILGVTRDITARKKEAEERKRNEDFLNATGKMAKVGGWELDVETGEKRWTDETFRICELPVGQLNDRGAPPYYHRDDCAKFHEARRQAIEHGKPYELELRLFTAKGNRRWIQSTCTPTIVDGKTVKLSGTFQDISQRKLLEEDILLLTQGFSAISGEMFFQHLVIHLARSLEADCVSVAMLPPGVTDRVRTIAVTEGTTVIENFEYHLAGTPCDHALKRDYCIYPSSVQEAFPNDEMLVVMDIEAYAAVPLLDAKSETIGILSVLFKEPVKNPERLEIILQTFAARASTEMEFIRIQREKAEQDARSGTIIENAVDGIVSIDERGLIESINPAAETLFGYSSAELIGQNVKILMPEPDRSQHDGHLNNYLRTGVPRFIGTMREVKGLRKDGAVFPLKIIVSETRFGETRLFTAHLHDLSREETLEQQLIQSQKMESLGTLAGGIAHDFNNSLQVIIGFCDEAHSLATEDNQDLINCLDEIRTSGNRAAQLVRQILTFSRTSRTDFQTVLVSTVIENALGLLRPSLPTMIEIKDDIEPNSGFVLGDETQIQQIMTNLCANAMLAMGDQGGTLTVKLQNIDLEIEIDTFAATLEPGQYLELSVQDTGVGIPPEILDRIVDPFFTTREVGEGTGLGLAIVLGITEKMNGGLTITSQVDKGTTVKVMLRALQQNISAHETPASAVATANGKGRILIVDDEEQISKLLEKTLTKCGFTAEVFLDPEGGLAEFKSKPSYYDLAIIDYAMAKMNGIDMAKKMHNVNQDFPILLATGYLDRNTSELPADSGISHILKKPYRLSELVDLINDFL